MLEQVMTHYISYYIGNTIQDWINSEGVDEPWLLGALPANTGTVLTEDHMTAIAEAVAYEVGNYTVQFRLTSPYPGFTHILAATVGSIVSKDYVEAHGGIENGDWNDHMWNHMWHICGCICGYTWASSGASRPRPIADGDPLVQPIARTSAADHVLLAAGQAGFLEEEIRHGPAEVAETARNGVLPAR